MNKGNFIDMIYSIGLGFKSSSHLSIINCLNEANSKTLIIVNIEDIIKSVPKTYVYVKQIKYTKVKNSLCINLV
jgi:hypothetical protein